MKRIFFLLLLISFAVSAQSERDYAFLYKDYQKGDQFSNLVQKRVYSAIVKNNSNHVYSWDENKHTIELLNTNRPINKPVAYVKYLHTDTYVDLNPPLEIYTDTTGKTVSVGFTINPSASGEFKLIDVATLKILDLGIYRPNSNTNTSITSLYKIPVVKFLEEFGEDPAKLKKRDFKAFKIKEDEVKAKYSKKIYENTINILNSQAASLAGFLSYVADYNNLPYYKVIKDPNAEDEKKMKYISFEAGKKDSLELHEELVMYQILTYDKIKSTKKVTYFYVDEIGESESKAKIVALGNKRRVADLIKENAELYLFQNERSVVEFNKKINKIDHFYNVGVRKECLFCRTSFEKNLLSVPVINTIERNAPEMTVFQEMAKLEKFIDFNSEDLLNKQVGIKYLFYLENNNLMATDIETGRVVGSESSKTSNLPSIVAKNLFIDIFESEIKFLKNDYVVKNKVKDMVIYSDYGLEMGEKLRVYVLEEEKVGNKILKRKKEIATGYIQKSISDFVGILNLRDGEKEVFEAQNANTKLYFDYLIK
jgi:hypothetical protein